jgi:hypothetical protein
MPSEPRIPTEPTLEELSAYLDHELDDDAKARVAEHVAGCADCQARLDGLRQTAYAIRALPMETPPRTFTIPSRRREPVRWAPVVGWIGGIAVAMLFIVVGVMHVPFHPGGISSAPAMQYNSGAGTAANKPAAPSAQGGFAQNDASTMSRSAWAYATTVSDPRDSSRTLTLATDASTYSATGTMTVQLRFSGLAPGSTVVGGLLLERNGYAVHLLTGSGSLDASGFKGTFQLSKLGLSDPLVGSYTLMAVEQLPGGEMLIARLPITIQG